MACASNGRAGASALLHGGAGRPHRGGLPWSGRSSAHRLAAHASHKGSRDHEEACRWVTPCARGAGRGLRPGSRSDAGSRHARGRTVFERTRTCADLVDRHGAGLGVLARPCGRARCHAAAHRAINPAVFLADAPRVSRRFAGPEGLALPPRCGGLRDGQDQPGRVVSARGHRVCEPVPTYPEGPRWAVGSRASRSQYLCAAMMPRARRATPEVRQPVATLRGSFTQAGRPRPWSSSQGSKLKTRP
jgi:hypothetical protein